MKIRAILYALRSGRRNSMPPGSSRLRGAFPDLLSGSVPDPRIIFWQNNIRFCSEMTFPGNLSLPIIFWELLRGDLTDRLNDALIKNNLP